MPLKIFHPLYFKIINHKINNQLPRSVCLTFTIKKLCYCWMTYSCWAGVLPQTPEIPECAILISAWGWIWGLQIFPVNEITVVRQVRMLPACTKIWARKQRSTECCTLHKNSERICFASIFVCMVGKNPKTPKLSPMPDYAKTWGGIWVSLLYICVCY